jgi:hypothetical protein
VVGIIGLLVLLGWSAGAQNIESQEDGSAFPASCSFAVPAFRESFRPQSLSPGAHSSFALNFTNDNMMLGLIPIGNDEGFTHALGFTTQKRISDNLVLTVRFATELYTRRAQGHAGFEDELHDLGHVDPASGNWVPAPRFSQEGTPIQFVDVERLMATLSHNGKVRLHITAGIERRTTAPLSGGRLPPAARIQDLWHNSLELYTYAYIPASGTPTAVHSGPDGKISLEEGYRTDRDILAIAPVSFFESLLIEKDVATIAGVCDIAVAGEMLLASEGLQGLSPNSYLSGSVLTNTVLLRKKRGKELGRPLLALSGAYGVRATPQGFGSSTGIGIVSHPGAGRGKVQVSPYMTLWYPQGQQTFDHLNDHNTIQQFGILFQFR